jgi:hypothetical protein
MTRLNRIYTTGVALIGFAMAFGPAQAKASHHALLCRSAEGYRLAVSEFHRCVSRSPLVDPCDVRLVCQLEEAACALRSAARHPQPLCDFLDLWQEVRSLHCRIESSLFGHGCARRDPHLAIGWRKVTYFYGILAEQIRCLEVHHPVAPQPTLLQPSVSVFPRAGVVGRRGRPSVRFHDYESHARALAERGRRGALARPHLPSTNVAVPPTRAPLPRSRSLVPSRHGVDAREIGSALIGEMLTRLVR